MSDASYNIATIDLETTMKCPVGNNKANPYWPDNRIVMSGVQYNDAVSAYAGTAIVKYTLPAKEQFIFVGHNIGFDLAYLYEKGQFDRQLVAKNDMIWDTQLAYYLLSGQQSKWPSLDEVCKAYGLPVKDDAVTSMFAAGKGADEIPESLLQPYLKADVENTHAIAKDQMEQVAVRGIMPFYMSQMDALLATIEMTHNGLAIDKHYLTEQADRLTTELTKIREDWNTLNGGRYTLDPFAPQQLSKILFGGTVKRKERVLVGKYLNGKDKYTTKEVVNTITGSIRKAEIKPEWVGKSGVVSTDDNVLHTLKHSTYRSKWNLDLIDLVLAYRSKSKQLSTYFEGLDKLIMPDGRIHHKLNHTATVTGRLSASDPNLQNQTADGDGNVKKAFVSRWGDKGVILEADYKQLEMVALAVLSGDNQLIEDISLGRDIHTELYISMHGRSPTDKERWSFKRCSFALVYGGGKKAIAAQGGTTVEEAATFIKVFYARYPGVKRWHDTMIEWADKARVYEGDKDKDTGLPTGVARMTTPTGRVLVFKEYPLSPEIKKWKGKDVGFSPTELKNYPPQSLATGDLVPLVLGKLLRVLKNNELLAEKCLMINTVHDSVLFDVHKDVLLYAIDTIRKVMEYAHIYMEETFGMKFPLPLKVEISVGPNWGEQEKV